MKRITKYIILITALLSFLPIAAQDDEYQFKTNSQGEALGAFTASTTAECAMRIAAGFSKSLDTSPLIIKLSGSCDEVICLRRYAGLSNLVVRLTLSNKEKITIPIDHIMRQGSEVIVEASTENASGSSKVPQLASGIWSARKTLQYVNAALTRFDIATIEFGNAHRDYITSLSLAKPTSTRFAYIYAQILAKMGGDKATRDSIPAL